MKNLKSVLAIVMALIIGVCLTGCQSANEKASNAEFSKWFSNVELVNTDGETSLKLEAITDNLCNPETVTLIIGDNEYLSTNFTQSTRRRLTNDSTSIISNNYFFTFDNVDLTDYDSITVTGKDSNDEAVTITYYPNAE
jgi:hypothetical protein